MKAVHFLLFIAIIWTSVSFAWSQEKAAESVFYREDQLYFGLNYLVVQSDASGFALQGLSSQFQFGILRDIPFHANGRWAVAVGLGFERTNIRSNLLWEDASLNYTPNSYRTYSHQGLSIPLELRWRSSTLTKYAFWRLYSGVKWQRNWEVGSLPEDVLRQWTPTFYTALGYNTWNLYVSTTLSSIYNEEVFSKKSIGVRHLALGLIFYLF